jgi:bifunctional DNase/RNase
VIDNPKENSMLQASAVKWVDASVTETRRSEGEDLLARKYIMILAEQDEDRRLRMRIRPDEATALALVLEPAEPPRPFTCKLAASLDATGSAVSEVITSLIAQVFYAAVIVRVLGARGRPTPGPTAR